MKILRFIAAFSYRYQKVFAGQTNCPCRWSNLPTCLLDNDSSPQIINCDFSEGTSYALQNCRNFENSEEFFPLLAYRGRHAEVTMADTADVITSGRVDIDRLPTELPVYLFEKCDLETRKNSCTANSFVADLITPSVFRHICFKLPFGLELLRGLLGLEHQRIAPHSRSLRIAGVPWHVGSMPSVATITSYHIYITRFLGSWSDPNDAAKLRLLANTTQQSTGPRKAWCCTPEHLHTCISCIEDQILTAWLDKNRSAPRVHTYATHDRLPILLKAPHTFYAIGRHYELGFA